MLQDNVKLRVMQDDGSYPHVDAPDAEPFCVQEYFAEVSYRRSDNRLPEEAPPAKTDAPEEKLLPIHAAPIEPAAAPAAAKTDAPRSFSHIPSLASAKVPEPKPEASKKAPGLSGRLDSVRSSLRGILRRK